MSERLRSIVNGMKIRPGDRVLEIGCGHGVAASYICDQLDGGHLVAIDRSKKMIDAAIRRNKHHVDAGKAEFYVADAVSFDPGQRRFDKILAVRVGLFHRDPTLVHSLLEKLLRPHGRVTIVYDEP